MSNISWYISRLIESYRLKEKGFVLISNNCWGYELYNVLARQYNTPFVGLFLFPECYIQFLENFETCINCEISFSKSSKYKLKNTNYPVGIIEKDIEVHFLHYSSEQEALMKWNRRILRLREAISANVQIFVKFCDRDGCTLDHMTRFHSLSFENKISIGINQFNSPVHLCCNKLKDLGGNSVMDGVKLYDRRYTYFDISSWILYGKVKRTIMSRFIAAIS